MKSTYPGLVLDRQQVFPLQDPWSPDKDTRLAEVKEGDQGKGGLHAYLKGGT